MSGKNILGKNIKKGKAILLCFILVAVAASVTMSPIISAWQGYRVRVPNVSVNMVESYPGAHSYFDTTLSGVGTGYDVQNGLYTGWCCDEHNYIYPGTLYSVHLWSTYNPLMPWPDPDWSKVNYLLNHKDPTASPDQIQSAIWYFIDGGYSGSDLKILGMIDDALAHGVNFVPQEAQICAVLVDAGTGIQHTFIEVLVPPPPCTVYVDKTYTVSTPGYGYDHFNIIQDGVDAVCNTGTVIVHSGIYNEHVTINKPITLQNGSLPIIDGGGSGNGITIAANDVTVNGFEIRNCANGISSYGTDNSIIKNNIIHDNLNTPSNAGGGIMLWSDVNDFDNNMILNNQIYNNDRQGIYIGGSYNDAIISNGNTIASNTIHNNGLNTLKNGPDNSAYGIQLSYADYNIIDSNNIYGHIWDYTGSGYWFGQGIYLNNAYQNSVTNNYLHNNNYGIVQYTDYTRTKGTNYVHCNDIESNTEYGIRNYDAVQMHAECNWWGAANGPGPVGPGSGDKVSTNVIYTTWVGYLIAEANGPYTSTTGVVHFSSTGTQGSGCCDETVLTYDWNFGDGSPHDSGANPTHTYTLYGTYTATLTVTVKALGRTFQATDTAPVTVPGSFSVNKTVWDGSNWVDNIRVINGTLLKFRVRLINNGGLTFGTTITDYLSEPQLKYRNSSTTPVSSSDHKVIWTTSIGPGATTDIIYYAWTVHVCYGLNTVFVTDSTGYQIGSDVSHVKVILSGADPEIQITKQVQVGDTWSDHISSTPNDKLTFKITVTSTALVAANNIMVTDVLPSLITYNNDASVTPYSVSSDTVIWKLGTMNPGDVKEITYTATVVNVGTDSNKANVTSTEGHYSEDLVLLEISSPTVQILYPQGGETLKGTATIQWSASDSKDGNNLPIFIYFKDVGSALWSAFTGNPHSNSGSLTWDTASIPDGSYELQIVTQDSNNNIGRSTSSPFQIKNHDTPPLNLPPNTPSTPTGTANGKPGVAYVYTSSATDPNGDQMYYLWDWGDGNTSGWLGFGPLGSGATSTAYHTYAVKGTYSIKVKAKDIYGAQSSWSDPLPITMPYIYKPILQFLELLLQRFPHAFPMLRHLLGY
jgi:uncharacterized repeat protein (TIGR01451 family)